MSDDDGGGAPDDGDDTPVAQASGGGYRPGRGDGSTPDSGSDGVVVHPGHVMGMSGLMDGVAGRYEAAVKFLQEHGRPDGGGWTGLLEQLKGPLAGAVDAFSQRLKAREADARESKGKFQDAARQYAGTDAQSAGALDLDVGGGGGSTGSGGAAGGDVEAEDYPSPDDVDFTPPEAPDSQQQEGLKRIVEQLSHSGVDAAVKKLTGHGLVEEILNPFVAHWPDLVKIGGTYGAFGKAEDQTMEVVDSGRQQLAENWQGPAHDAADAHLKDRVGGGDAPIGHTMAELLTAVHDGIEQTIQGLIEYLQGGLNQQGTYKGQTVTVAQLAANQDKLPPDVAQELQDPLTTFAQNALEYVQTGQQIVDEAKQGIGQIEAGDTMGAAALVGKIQEQGHAEQAKRAEGGQVQAAADISGFHDSPLPGGGSALDKPFDPHMDPHAAATLIASGAMDLPKEPKFLHDFWEKLNDDDKLQLYNHDHRIGCQDGIPAEDRNKYNTMYLDSLGVNNVTDHIRNAVDKKYSPPRYLLGIDGSGHPIISIGNPDKAADVAVLVPGASTDVNDAETGADRAAKMQRYTNNIKIASGDSGSTAVIYWDNYDPPDKWRAPMDDSSAVDAAPKLDNFVSGLRSSHEGNSMHISVVGHSYGSVVIGQAANSPLGLLADDVVSIGGIGTDHYSALDFSMLPLYSEGHVWAGMDSGDGPAIAAAEVGNHGPLPTQLNGVQAFPAGHHALGRDPHSGYWNDSTGDDEALWSMAFIIAGRYPSGDHKGERYPH